MLGPQAWKARAYQDIEEGEGIPLHPDIEAGERAAEVRACQACVGRERGPVDLGPQQQPLGEAQHGAAHVPLLVLQQLQAARLQQHAWTSRIHQGAVRRRVAGSLPFS